MLRPEAPNISAQSRAQRPPASPHTPRPPAFGRPGPSPGFLHSSLHPWERSPAIAGLGCVGSLLASELGTVSLSTQVLAGLQGNRPEVLAGLQGNSRDAALRAGRGLRLVNPPGHSAPQPTAASGLQSPSELPARAERGERSSGAAEAGAGRPAPTRGAGRAQRLGAS